MQIQRFFRHVAYTDWQTQRAFGPGCLKAIEKAIHDSEQQHGGEIRFAVEGGLDASRLVRGQSARGRALEVFSQLRVWDTEHNNGVLIYVLLADHAVEIVADRGIHLKAGSATWDAICKDMQTEFAKSANESGAVKGIARLTQVMAAHFAPATTYANELPNAPMVLS